MNKVGKQIKVAPGIRLNLNKQSVGASIGGEKLRFNYNSRTGSKLSGRWLGQNWSLNWPGLRLGNRETEASRKQRELKQRALEMDKLEAREQASLEVEIYENEVERLVSFHWEPHPEVQWLAISKSGPPFDPEAFGPLAQAAQEALDNYRPAFWRRWFKMKDQQKIKLQEELAHARDADQLHYNNWVLARKAAEEILAGDLSRYHEVILHTLEPEEMIGSTGQLEWKVRSAEVVEVAWQSLSDRLIPTEIKSLTKTGKVSVQNMSKTRFYALYQDYVCSVAMRIALDLFAILPLNTVYVHVSEERVVTATGHRMETALLSVRFDRETLLSLNHRELDPSDALHLFEHRMNFKRTGGFQQIDLLVVSPKSVDESAG